MKATSSLPWPSVAALASCLAMLVGWHWDISWHRSIGRDTLFTLPHLAIYFALGLAFAYNAWLVLDHSFGAGRSKPAIRVLGFRGPSASFLTLWSILVMLSGILFDAWWHEAYGLDVGVFSPPHYVLSFALAFVYAGQFVYVVIAMNQGVSRWHVPLALGVWGLYLGHQLILDPSYGPRAATTPAYILSSALVLPLSLVLIQRVLRLRWAPVIASLFYFAVVVVLMQVFQLFPATPALGPVYHRISGFLPPLFPLFIALPALLVGELTWRIGEGSRRTVLFLAAGPAFVGSFLAVNLAWAALLAGPLGRNRLIGGHHPAAIYMPDFLPVPAFEGSASDWLVVLLASALAAGSSWVGFIMGDWLRGLRR